MSQVGDAFTALESVVSTTLTDHKEHINPYFMEDASNLRGEKGYSVGYAEGRNLQTLQRGIEFKSRDFVVNITRRAYTLRDDQAGRKAVEEALFSDQEAVVAAVSADEKLGEPCTIYKAEFVSDGGIEFIRSDDGRKDFFLLRTVFEVQYQVG